MKKSEREEETATEIAADGYHVPGACNTMADFIRQLEYGQFDADAYAAVRELAEDMADHAAVMGGKATGKIVITLDFKQEIEVTEIRAKVKVTRPEAPRSKSIMYQTDDHRMTGVHPSQREFFGIRDVSNSARTIRDA